MADSIVPVLAERPACAVHGMLHPRAMCGYIICGGDDCGAPTDVECEHTREASPASPSTGEPT